MLNSPKVSVLLLLSVRRLCPVSIYSNDIYIYIQSLQKYISESGALLLLLLLLVVVQTKLFVLLTR